MFVSQNQHAENKPGVEASVELYETAVLKTVESACQLQIVNTNKIPLAHNIFFNPDI